MSCLPILVSIILLMKKPVEKAASKFLALSLFACVFSIVPQIIGFAGFYNVWPNLTFFPFSLELWIGPLIYFHAFVLLTNAPLKWRKWLLLPGIIQTLYYSWAFLFLGDYKSKWAFDGKFHSPYVSPIESILAVVSIILALIAIWRLYTRYVYYVHNTESIALEFEPTWLKRIIVFLCVAGLLFAGIRIFDLIVDVSYINSFPIHILIMMSLAWLSIEAVWRINQSFPNMPLALISKRGISDVINKTRINPAEQLANETTGITLSSEAVKAKEDQDESALQTAKAIQIRNAVIDNEWFLAPRFSLRQLAQNMATNDVYISKAINQGLAVSFNDFINQLRVDYAQSLMRKTNMPLLTIALDSGFNSKATFNRVYKNLCGHTPSDYKKKAKGLE
jgi:AraC-like DNA-binding protein